LPSAPDHEAGVFAGAVARPCSAAPTNVSNLQALCVECNLAKGANPPTAA
jgi:hypothetical protein